MWHQQRLRFGGSFWIFLSFLIWRGEPQEGEGGNQEDPQIWVRQCLTVSDRDSVSALLVGLIWWSPMFPGGTHSTDSISIGVSVDMILCGPFKQRLRFLLMFGMNASQITIQTKMTTKISSSTGHWFLLVNVRVLESESLTFNFFTVLSFDFFPYYRDNHSSPSEFRAGHEWKYLK